MQVRCDARKKWTIFINAKGQRSNTTVGEGRDNFIKAIKAAEVVAKKLENLPQDFGQKKPEESVVMFREYSKEWLNGNKGRWSVDTYEKYEIALRLHLYPFPEFNVPLNKICRKTIKKRLRDYLETHSPSSVATAYNVLSGIFNEAIDDKLIHSNPASGLLKSILPPVSKRNVTEADHFDIEDRDLFLKTADDICLPSIAMLFRVMAFSGMRLGEALAMRPEYLDFQKKNYYACESFRIKRFGLPKKGKKRYIDLPIFLMEELTRYVAQLKKESMANGTGGDVGYLFLNPTDHTWPFSQKRIRQTMIRVCKTAGLRVRHPHDLRHTYATILLMAHTSPAYIQRQLGHSKIQTTIDIYGHWIPGEGRDGLEDALTKYGEEMHKNTHKTRHTNQPPEIINV